MWSNYISLMSDYISLVYILRSEIVGSQRIANLIYLSTLHRILYYLYNNSCSHRRHKKVNHFSSSMRHFIFHLLLFICIFLRQCHVSEKGLELLIFLPPPSQCQAQKYLLLDPGFLLVVVMIFRILVTYEALYQLSYANIQC